jgi:serine/threonine protein phosphatase PrpC
MEPGYDKVNQDYICIQSLTTEDASKGQSYMFAVLDGHGSEGVLVDVPAYQPYQSCLS